MIRKLWKLLAAVLVVIVIALVALYLTIDSIAKAGVERGGTYALGVNTTVDSASVSLLGGSLGLSGLAIDNPAGYSDAKLLRSGSVNATVKTGSLFSDVIEVPTIEISNIEVNIEQKLGANNVSDVVNHIKSLSSGSAKTEGGKRLKIDTITLRNITANVQLLPVGGKTSTVTVQVPLIELKNVTDGSNGALVGDVVARIFPAIIAAVIEKGKGIMPADLAGQLSGDVAAAAQSLGESGAKILDQAGKTAEGVGKTITDLFGKKKDDAEK